MEDHYEEFDLRPFVELLLGHWKFIVGTAVVFAITALIVSQLMPAKYKAMALLVETAPQDDIQFDPRIVSADNDSGDKTHAYISIATSDDALQRLLDSIEPPLEGAATLYDIRKIVQAEASKDTQIVELIVTYNDSERAAEVVNLWAEQFVVDINALYSQQGNEQLTFFEEQLAQTRISQEEVEDLYIVFQSRNSISTIGNELSALNTAQTRYLAEENNLILLMENITNFRTQLNEQSEPMSMADQLTVISLQTQLFDAQKGFPVQLQMDAETLLNETDRNAQIERLDGLLATVEYQQSKITDALAALAPQILNLQEERQILATERDDLTQEKSILDETVLTLARKIEEERITSQNTSSGVQLVSKAAVPEKAESSSTLVSVFLAATIGVMLAVGFVFARNWWQDEQV